MKHGLKYCVCRNNMLQLLLLYVTIYFQFAIYNFLPQFAPKPKFVNLTRRCMSALETKADITAQGCIPDTPIIFQCVTCNTIVGDSFALVHSDQEHQTVTLSAVSNIKWSSSVDTAKSGFDVGNTYFLFSCKFCEVEAMLLSNHCRYVCCRTGTLWQILFDNIQRS
jgi:hypothetical protein